jgi:hypothetical protein
MITLNAVTGITSPNIDSPVGDNTPAAGDFTDVTVSGTLNTGGGALSPQTGFKNRIINGSMTIDQRNAGASVTANNDVFFVDRFQMVATQTSKLTAQRNAGAVTPPVGFANYLGFTSSSAYALTSGDIFAVRHKIEGFNISDLAWGSASASFITVSFVVRSSLTGTFGGAIENSAGNRCYPFSYTISVANTWENKTITIPGDTSGTWLTDNGTGLQLAFGLGVGSTNSGAAGAWGATRFWSATGATSVVGTSGATFYITGVQLEKGSVATPFEFRSIGDELALCQRYYQGNLANGTSSGNRAIFRGSSSATGAFYYWFPFLTQMRISPTMSVGTPDYVNTSSAQWANIQANGAEMVFNVSVAGGYVFVPWRAEAEL